MFIRDHRIILDETKQDDELAVGFGLSVLCNAFLNIFWINTLGIGRSRVRRKRLGEALECSGRGRGGFSQQRERVEKQSKVIFGLFRKRLFARTPVVRRFRCLSRSDFIC